MRQRTFRALSTVIPRLGGNICRVYVGKEAQILTVLAAFAAGLHVLIEDVPGVGKTTLARSLAVSAGLDFGRIQFTPDLLPGDVTGMTIWSPEKREFVYKQGAVMHQFVLADEINRASPRTQASLLEAMQEGSVSVDGVSYRLPQPFLLMATQNPVSFLGVFPLPEGELDRFGISLSLGYPPEQDEIEILSRFQDQDPLADLRAVVDPAELIAVRQQVRAVHVAEAIKRFVVQIAAETRTSKLIRLGLSPRASQHLLLAAQAEAFVQKRDYVVPEDVLSMAPAVLAHRLVLSAEARMDNASPRSVLDALLRRVKIPTGLHER